MIHMTSDLRHTINNIRRELIIYGDVKDGYSIILKDGRTYHLRLIAYQGIYWVVGEIGSNYIGIESYEDAQEAIDVYYELKKRFS